MNTLAKNQEWFTKDIVKRAPIRVKEMNPDKYEDENKMSIEYFSDVFLYCKVGNGLYITIGINFKTFSID